MKSRVLVGPAICLAVLLQVAFAQANDSPPHADQASAEPANAGRLNDDEEKTKLEQNKAVVRGYLNEVVDQGNLTAFDNYFAAEVLLNGTIDNKGLRQFLAESKALNKIAFPDLHLTIVEQIAVGDKVTTRIKLRGTHLGDYRGIAATGKSVTYAATAVDRIKDGKVIAMWHVVNRQELLQQIGASPP